MSLIEKLTEIRAYEPERIEEALVARRPGELPRGENLMIIACDHPARGALGAGDDPMAMASREVTLERCVEALSRPGVHGFLGTADMIEDLALLGALEGKLVWGSMNRTGLQGAAFEMDDRFNCYDAAGIAKAKLDGGKMLTRINYADVATAPTLEATAKAVNELADHKLQAMVEPFISEWKDGRIVNDLSPDAVIKSIAIASGLAKTSAYTWLKLPCVDEMERVMDSTTLPSLILGGEVPDDPDRALEGWAAALALPNVKGLVIGRSLLFPPDGDVSRAVDNAVSLL
ncbi:MAG: deoxyribose-phosphate aldolase [Actinomycetaceae bacterium]|nr:deoxyribose-phosphate aldolase [Actinomycetaceae bacterium]